MLLAATVSKMPTTRSSSRASRASKSGVHKTAPRPRPAKRAPKQGATPHKGLKKKSPHKPPPHHSHEPPPAEVALLEPQIPIDGTIKVARVYNELWESTLDSLAFIDHGLLETDADTEIITLNLIDHIIKEENWNPALSMNKLSAACFLFASRVTGKKNVAADIALSFEPDAEKYASALLATINQSRMATDYTVRIRIAQALKMSAEDIEYGYRILWEQRSELRELVGDYAKDMEWVPIPEGVSIEERSHQAAIEDRIDKHEPQADVKQDEGGSAQAKADELLMRVAEAPLISPAFIELDDFENSVAEYE